MSEIRVKEGESLESALRRLQAQLPAAVCSQRSVTRGLTRSRLLAQEEVESDRKRKFK